ncbi:uncharacterized protein [Haliotis asinina]|uniref:uncharacterized protein n=1 Tax=Haliotis asinina TaxID=109174 RepID=UPI0035320162
MDHLLCLVLTLAILVSVHAQRPSTILVRLVGNSPAYGRVEVRNNATAPWGTVCSDFWGNKDATVTCRMLGYRWGRALRYYGGGSGMIYMDSVECTGNENTLAACRYAGWTIHNCQHYEDAGVSCSDNTFRLVGNTLVSSYRIPTTSYGAVQYRDPTGWKPVCDSGWDDNDAKVLCRSMGYRDGSALSGSKLSPYTYNPPLYTLRSRTNLNCSGSEANIFNCTNQQRRRDCNNKRFASAICYSQPKDEVDLGFSLQLVNGTDVSGQVIVTKFGVAGKICANNWNVNASNVVCKQLGFIGGVTYGTTYTRSDLPVWITSVNCTGLETSLEQCVSSVWGLPKGYCYPANVLCYRSSPPQLSLAGGDSSHGRVQISIDGQTGTVCDNSFSNGDARVVCQTLGFRDGNYLKGSYYGPGSGPIFMDRLYCSGYERTLWSCRNRGWRNPAPACDDHSKDASVTCFNEVRLYRGDHSHGAVQLWSRTGRYSRWQPVCGTGFDDSAAKVVCRELGFQNGRALPRGSYGALYSSSYFGSNITCTGDEASIRNCTLGSGTCSRQGYTGYASVSCYNGSISTATSIKLTGGPDGYQDVSGHVAVNKSGISGRICEVNWDDTDAGVVCRQLGMAGGVSYQFNTRAFGPFLLSEVNCFGNETSLFNCPTGTIRVELVGGTAMSGRVEIIYNGVRGTTSIGDVVAVLTSIGDVVAVLTSIGDVVALLTSIGDVVAVLTSIGDVVALQTSIGDVGAVLTSIGDVVAVLTSIGDLVAVLTSIGDVVALLTSIGDVVALQTSIGDVGAVLTSIGDVGAVQTSIGDVGALLTSIGDVVAVLTSIGDVVAVLTSIGDVVAVLTSIGDVVAVLTSIGDVGAVLTSIGDVGAVQTSIGDVGAVLTSIGDVVALLTSIGDVVALLTSIGDVVALQTSIGDVVAVLTSIGDVVALQTSIGDVGAVLTSIGDVGAVLTSIGDVVAVLTSIGDVVALLTSIGDVGAVLTSIGDVVALLTSIGDVGAVLTSIGDVGAVLTSIGDVVALQTSIGDVVAVLTSIGDVVALLTSIGDVVAVLTSIGDVVAVQTSIGDVGAVLTSIGDVVAVQTSIGDVGAVLTSIGDVVAVLTSIGDVVALLTSIGDVGAVLTSIGDVVAVLTSIGDVGAVLSSIGDVVAVLTSIGDVGAVLTSIGDVGALQTSIGDVVAVQTSIGDVVAVLTSIGDVVALQTSIGDVVALLTSIGDVGAVLTSIGDVVAVQTCIGDVVAVLTSIGDVVVVLTSIGDVVAVLTSIGDVVALLTSIGDVGAVQTPIGDVVAVLTSIGDVVAVLTSIGDVVAVLTSIGDVVALLTSIGDVVAVLTSIGDVSALLTSNGDDVLLMLNRSFGPGSGQVFISNPYCFGYETSVFQCLNYGLGVQTTSCQSHTYDLGVECYGNVKLVQGTTNANASIGIVQFFKDNTWRIICGSGFDNYDAAVVCRELGYPYGFSLPRGTFGTRYYSSSISYVNCTGSESTVADCGFRVGGCINYYPYNNYASVICSKQPVTNDFEVIIGTTFPSMVRVRKMGLNATVCNNGWGDEEARVVCRSKGYVSGVAFGAVGYSYNTPPRLLLTNCIGNETRLQDCAVSTNLPSSCSSSYSKAAYVYCYNDNTGVNLRLMNNGQISNSAGRVEVQIGGVWGSVCGYSLSSSSARVICKTLGYPDGSGQSTSTYGRGTGPVWLYSPSCTVRLRPNRQYGAVQVYDGTSSYQTVCADNFNDIDAKVVCNEIGYQYGVSVGASAFGRQYYGIGFTNVRCTGRETRFRDCPYDISMTYCPSRKYASAACSNTNPRSGYTLTIQSTYQGRITIRHMGIDGYVCPDGFDDREAMVICREKGFTGGFAYTYYHRYYSFYSSSTMRWLSNINCDGTETYLSNCAGVRFGDTTNCSSSGDAAVYCYQTSGLQVRLGNKTGSAGRVELSVDGTWGTMCTLYSGTYYTDKNADVLCRMLNYTTGRHMGLGSFGPVRLMGAATVNYGRVEVYRNKQWSPVCDHNFDNAAARVVCRKLGYADGKAQCCNAVGNVDASTITVTVNGCSGSESDLLSCNLAFGSCSTGKYATVYCSYNNIYSSDLAVRLRDSSKDYGSIEVNRYGFWGPVCNVGWNNKDADVACRSMGFVGGVTFSGQIYSSAPMLVGKFNCQGGESNLTSCPFSDLDDKVDLGCNSAARSYRQTAGVLCYDRENGASVRLADGGSNYGRVEVNYNGVWGRVCGWSWSDVDAKVVCRHLGFQDGSSRPVDRNNNTKVWMNYVRCTGSEASLFECPSYWNYRWGCSRDAGVVCYDTLRLSRGNQISMGVVEVYYNKNWGSVCSNGWSDTDVSVACKELGYQKGFNLCCGVYGSRSYAVLDNVQCRGSEAKLIDCPSDNSHTRYCSGADASVACYNGTAATSQY